MALVIDSERREVQALRKVTDWRGKRVLEIGCGEGRLTRRLAQLGAIVTAIDPDAQLIHAARRKLSGRFARTVRYQVGKAERLKRASQPYDLVVFAWAL